MTVPAPEAPFAETMAYYRTQHTSRGVRGTHLLGTHLLGTPVIAFGMPLLLTKPRVGLPMFVGAGYCRSPGTECSSTTCRPPTRAGSLTNSPGSFMSASSTANCWRDAADAAPHRVPA